MPFPLVVEKRKTVKVGGNATTQITQNFAFDIKKQTLADLKNALIDISVEQTKIQTALNNPPTAVATDNNRSKPITSVQRKVEIAYGNQLQAAALRQVEILLRKNILASTVKRKGVLSDMNNWEWLLITKSGAKKIRPAEVGTLGVDDKLILRPAIAYAGLANSAVAQQSARGNSKGKAKRNRGMGFMGATAQKAKRSRFFKLFTIYASFSKRFANRQEYMTERGAPVIVVRARKGKFSVRRISRG